MSSFHASDLSAQGAIIRILHEQFAELSAQRAGFSLRAFARLLGLNPTQLTETLNGKRPITRKIAVRVLERLGLDPEMGRLLVEALPAKQVRKKIVPGSSAVLQYVQLSADEFRMVSDWWHFAILSLAETRGFKSDPKWIAMRLGLQLRLATGAVERLVRLGLLVRQARGKLVPTGRQFTTGNDVPNAFIRRNHIQGLEQAREAIEQVPVELREFAASIVAVDPKLLPQAKERLRELRREMVALLESGEKQEVYRLSIQLYPLTQKKEDRYES
ncbi:MAG: TIGR02147 family protein [Bdellovibrionota bacterium]